MRGWSLIAAGIASLAVVSAAQAGERSKPQVYVCENPTPAKAVVHREHGRMTFVSAERLLNERTPAAKPRCITEAQLERYRELSAQRTRVVASR